LFKLYEEFYKILIQAAIADHRCWACH